MSNNAVHRQRAQLFFRQKGKCHYCGCDMVLMWRIPPYFRPPNLCTVEHLNDRNGGPRPDLQGEFLRVAACNQCNFERGAESQARQPIEELHRRSRRHPSAESSQ